MKIDNSFRTFFKAKAKDEITKMEGVIVAFDFWMNGCVRVGIQLPIDKDGKVGEILWIDSQQVELIQPEKIDVKKHTSVAPSRLQGGPQRDPKGY